MTKRPLTSGRWLKPVAAMTGVAIMTIVALLAPGLSAGPSNLSEQSSVKTALPGPCLLPASEMRRKHKALLFEERTKAVRNGIRNPEASLTRCVACHAVHDEAGVAVAYEDERHFCRACHMRVAVAPDCFSCHRSTPMAPDPAEGKP